MNDRTFIHPEKVNRLKLRNYILEDRVGNVNGTILIIRRRYNGEGGDRLY